MSRVMYRIFLALILVGVAGCEPLPDGPAVSKALRAYLTAEYAAPDIEHL